MKVELIEILRGCFAFLAGMFFGLMAQASSEEDKKSWRFYFLLCLSMYVVLWLGYLFK